MKCWTGFLLVAALSVLAAAQGPPNAPCATNVGDCCLTGLETVVVNGVSYVHQVCSPRSVARCSIGCTCVGDCADSTAQCSCLSQPPSLSQSQTPSPTAPVSPSSSATSAPSTTHTSAASQTRTPTASGTPSPSVSLSSTRINLDVSPTPLPSWSATSSQVPIIIVVDSPSESATPPPTASPAVSGRDHSGTVSSVVPIVVSVVAVVCAIFACLTLTVVWRVWRGRRVYKNHEMVSAEPPLRPDDSAELINGPKND